MSFACAIRDADGAARVVAARVVAARDDDDDGVMGAWAASSWSWFMDDVFDARRVKRRD